MPASKLKTGPNIWNLAVVDNIDISQHTFSYGNIFDVTLHTSHAMLRTVFQIEFPDPETSCPTDHIEQMLPEPLFVDNQFTNEWIEKFNNVFSTLCEENGKDFLE